MHPGTNLYLFRPLLNGIIREKSDGISKKNLSDTTDHDRLFKLLLQTFFAEFIERFFPQVYSAIDFSHLRFLSQEVFTDLVAGDKRILDLLAETKLKGEEGLILIHVEPQSYVEKAFAERMFIYCSRLYEKYRRPILPIAIFSYDTVRDEPDRFEIRFPFMNVLSFRFYKLELKKLNWRDFLKRENPVAAALLSKMGYRKDEKVKVKLEFLRMLVKLRLDPARMELLTTFFETYLQLNEDEEKSLMRELEKTERKEERKIMELVTSWERKGFEKGMEQGIEEGKMALLLKQLNKRFGAVPKDVEMALRSLPSGKIDEVGENIFDMKSIDELRELLGSWRANGRGRDST